MQGFPVAHVCVKPYSRAGEMKNVSSKVQAESPPKTPSTTPAQGDLAKPIMAFPPHTRKSNWGRASTSNTSAQEGASETRRNASGRPTSGPCQEDCEVGLLVGVGLVHLAVVPPADGESIVPQRSGVLQHPRRRQRYIHRTASATRAV